MINIGKKTLISLFACAAITTTSIAQTNKTYAVVNGEKIQASDIAIALRNPQLNFDSIPKDQQKNILKNIIEQKVLEQNAYKTKKITQSKEYKQELEKLKQNLAYQIWLRDFSKTVKVKVDKLKKYYDKNKSKFKKPLTLKASHILVSTKDEANKIIKELSKTSNIKKAFTKLAKEKSTGPSGQTGGELGWFTKDKMVPEFSNAAEKLKKGEFTKTPVKTQFGYHIIYLDDRSPATTLTFDQVKQKLEQEFLQKEFVQKIKAKAKSLVKKAKIQYK
jgi:parvulin-like peptidyl-prolyl isomerase